MRTLSHLLTAKEERENIILPENAEIAVNSPRTVRFQDGIVSKIRGQHFKIHKEDISSSN
jgi:hypothetical protein